jgi:hypothetical protein
VFLRDDVRRAHDEVLLRRALEHDHRARDPLLQHVQIVVKQLLHAAFVEKLHAVAGDRPAVRGDGPFGRDSVHPVLRRVRDLRGGLPQRIRLHVQFLNFVDHANHQPDLGRQREALREELRMEWRHAGDFGDVHHGEDELATAGVYHGGTVAGGEDARRPGVGEERERDGVRAEDDLPAAGERREAR